VSTEEHTEGGWEARMAARARERAAARGEPVGALGMREGEREYTARQRAEQMAEHPERFSPEPPDDPSVCLSCSEWLIENEQMGRFAWWSTCDRVPCPCCHCDEAVIIA
jgi:hypothetical protein